MTERSSLHVVTTRGIGETVVFLHGLGGTHRYWQAALEGTAARCVLVDLLGFGASPRPWRRYTLAAHLDALEDALLAHAPFALIGHSMGAVLALALAVRRPDLVSRLGLLSLPCYDSEAAAYDWMRRLPGGWVYTNIFAAALACMITRRVAGRLLPYLLRDYPRVVAEDLVKHNFLSFTTSLWEVLYRHDPAGDAARLPAGVPVVCVHGDADRSAPIANARRLAERSANWRFAELPGIDHHPWLRAPARCKELLGLDATGEQPRFRA
jgi:pimeloyl-ACP methyl ester carboxylesterase